MLTTMRLILVSALDMGVNLRPPLPTQKKRLLLTIEHFRLKMHLFISKPGKQDPYHTLTVAYHGVVAQTWR